MSLIYITLSIIFGYIIGSIPTALIIGKITKGIDIREYGSKNSGATNAGRILGRKYFFIVTIIDAIKCILGMLFSYILFVSIFNKFDISPKEYTLAVSCAGTFAMIGHCYPVFAGFRGGKGVATALGYIFLSSPLCGIGVVIVFAIVSLKSKYISLGSICASIFTILYTWIIFFIFKENYPIMGLNLVNSLGFSIVTTIFALTVILKHIPNIKRLINKCENKINF